MFGQPQSTPFGSPPGGGFGQQNTAPGGFGTPAPSGFGAAPATGGFGGGFGSTAPAPVFGGGGGFGSPAPASGFGGGGTTFGSAAPATSFGAPAVGGFGAPSSTPFGAPAPSAGGMFGAPAAAPTGFGGGSSLFGSSPAPATGGFGGGFGSAPAPATGGFGGATGGFGSTVGGFGSATNSAPAFGSSATTSTFGAPPAPGGGLFGAPAPSPSTGFGATGFGSAPAPSAFGAPAPSPAGFGAPVGGMAGAAGGGGTKATPFQTTNRQDGASGITLHSITAMPQYENKSFEELRFEDYSQGNKGSGGATQPSTTGGFGTFGSPAPAPSGLFGSAAPAPFGAPAPTPGGFGGFGGTPAPAAFGSPAPTPGAFGAPASGAFGSTNSAFGANPQSTPGLFGAPAPTPSSAFGAPAPTTPSLFGSTTPAPFGASAPTPSTGAFGAPAPGAPSLFGAPSPGAFGAPAPTAGSLFGAPPSAPSNFGGAAPAPGGFGFGAAPSSAGFGGFGSNPAPSAFGAPAPGGFGGFGSTPGSAFGATPSSTGIFGQPAAAPGGSIFGQPPAPASAFDGFSAPPPAAPPVAVAPPIGSVMPAVGREIVQSQLAALETRQKEWEGKNTFQNQPSPSAAIVAATLPERESGSLRPFTPGRLIFPTRRPSPSSTAKIRPRGFTSPTSDSANNYKPQSLSKLGSTGKPMVGPESAAAFSATRLVIAPSTQMRLLQPKSEKKDSNSNAGSQNIGGSGVRVGEMLGAEKRSKLAAAFSSPAPVSTPISRTDITSPNGTHTPSTPKTMAEQYFAETGDDQPAGRLLLPTQSNVAQLNVAPKLTKPGYVCSPSISELLRMDPQDLAAVDDFKVERLGVGKVEWEGAVDVRNADLDKIIVIEPKSVSVYTDEETVGTKPEIGKKLNRPALLTMEGVNPPEGSGPEAIDKFYQKVVKQTMKIGAELVEYDPSIGIWKIRVVHFSRYAFDDDSEDDDDATMNKSSIEQTPMKRKVDFRLGEPGVLSPEEATGATKKLRQDTPFKPRTSSVEEESDLVSDHETKSFEKAEALFGAMNANLAREKALLSQKQKDEDDKICFPEEVSLSYEETDVVMTRRYRPGLGGQHAEQKTSSITSQIFGTSTKSSFDYSRRMGKSFRVGWGPDGSFLCLGHNGGIARSRPIFDDGISVQPEVLLAPYKQFSRRVDGQSGYPLFSITPISQWDAAGQVIASYIKAIGGTWPAVKLSFDVLKVVQEAGKARSLTRGTDALLEERCVVACTRILVSCCSREVQQEHQQRGQPRDIRALLTAVSSGDVDLAARRAHEMNSLHLSVVLCSSSDSRRAFVNDMSNLEKIPRDFKRIYETIAGEISMDVLQSFGVESLEWKRLMAMQMVYPSGSSDAPKDMRSVIQNYEKSVRDGKAPFPAPDYAGKNADPSVECVLFKLLKLEADKDGILGSLSSTIDPRGYSRNPHDFSFAFHLAAAISALPDQKRLSKEEEETLVEGLIAQLLSKGQWEWGVYVSLCSITSENATSSLASWRFRKAKSLICQHMEWDDIETRERLESVGVPKEVFEEALSFRALSEFNTHLYISHLSDTGMKEKARKELERSLLPKSLFTSIRVMKKIIAIADECSTGGNSLVEILPILVDTSLKIRGLKDKPQDEVNRSVRELFAILDTSEETLLAYQSSERRRLGNGVDLHQTCNIPLGAFIVKALNDITHLRLQAMAAKEGMSNKATTSELLKLVRERHSPEMAANFQRYLL